MNATIRPSGAVTLSWLLERPALGLRLLAGPDPETVEVRWAHSIELEDPSPWLEGGELVLVTGLRWRGGTDEATTYVRRLVEAGSAGLGFGIGVRFASVPRALVQACKDADLPLVEVPLETPFLAVVRELADHLAQERRRELQQAVDFGRRLTAATLDRGVGGLVAGAATDLGWPVLVLDAHLDRVAASGATTGLAARVREELDRSPGSSSLSVIDADRHLSVMRVGSPTRSMGWLAVESAEAPTASERLLLHQAAALLALQLARSADLEDRFRELGAAALGQLLGAAEERPSLAAFGFPDGDRVRVVVAEPGRGRPGAAAAVEQVLGARRVRHVLREDGAVAVAVVPADIADADVLDWVDGLGRLGRPDVVVGVSGPTLPARAGDAVVQARRAVASARLGHERMGWYGAFGLEDLLDDEVVRARVRSLTGAAVADLLGSDTDRDRELVRTLRVHLEHHGSWESASRALGIHRHTLRQRIDRLRDLGIDVDHPHERAALLLSLLADDR